MKILKLNYNIITGSEYVWVEVPDEIVLSQQNEHSNTVFTNAVRTKMNLCEKAKCERQR